MRLTRLALCLLLMATLPQAAAAQTRKINNLKKERTQLEQGIRQQKNRLSQTRQETQKKEQDAGFIEQQLQNRLEYIHRLEAEIDSLDAQVDTLEHQVAQLDSQVTLRRNKYVQSLRYARESPSLRNPLLFLCSAESFPQLTRRLRHAREFAALQKTLGLQLMEKQNQARNKQNQLLDLKQQRSGVVQEIIFQRRQLTDEHSVVKSHVAQLHRQQKEIERQVGEQQRKLDALNSQIDKLVEYELEQQRKRAEAERRRKAEQQKKAAQSGNSKAGTNKQKPAGKAQTSTAWITAEDRQLNGNLEQNKGRLPVPLTGPYRIVRHYGMQQITTGVVLDNKGINIMGQPGARARAVFDGEVSAVFQLGTLRNVLVRHGSYISVYCNLSSTIVRRGQKVKARDILGTVAQDEKGEQILHFQLRRETQKLNPEQWLGR